MTLVQKYWHVETIVASLYLCTLQRNPIFEKTKTDYSMSVSGDKFFLRNIYTKSQYSFTETNVKEGAIFTYVA